MSCWSWCGSPQECRCGFGAFGRAVRRGLGRRGAGARSQGEPMTGARERVPLGGPRPAVRVAAPSGRWAPGYACRDGTATVPPDPRVTLRVGLSNCAGSPLVAICGSRGWSTAVLSESSGGSLSGGPDSPSRLGSTASTIPGLSGLMREGFRVSCGPGGQARGETARWQLDGTPPAGRDGPVPRGRFSGRERECAAAGPSERLPARGGAQGAVMRARWSWRLLLVAEASPCVSGEDLSEEPAPRRLETAAARGASTGPLG